MAYKKVKKAKKVKEEKVKRGRGRPPKNPKLLKEPKKTKKKLSPKDQATKALDSERNRQQIAKAQTKLT